MVRCGMVECFSTGVKKMEGRVWWDVAVYLMSCPHRPRALAAGMLNHFVCCFLVRLVLLERGNGSHGMLKGWNHCCLPAVECDAE